MKPINENDIKKDPENLRVRTFADNEKLELFHGVIFEMREFIKKQDQDDPKSKYIWYEEPSLDPQSIMYAKIERAMVDEISKKNICIDRLLRADPIPRSLQ